MDPGRQLLAQGVLWHSMFNPQETVWLNVKGTGLGAVWPWRKPPLSEPQHPHCRGECVDGTTSQALPTMWRVTLSPSMLGGGGGWNFHHLSAFPAFWLMPSFWPQEEHPILPRGVREFLCWSRTTGKPGWGGPCPQGRSVQTASKALLVLMMKIYSQKWVSLAILSAAFMSSNYIAFGTWEGNLRELKWWNALSLQGAQRLW